MDVMDNLQRDRETIQKMRGRVRGEACVWCEGCGEKKGVEVGVDLL